MTCSHDWLWCISPRLITSPNAGPMVCQHVGSPSMTVNPLNKSSASTRHHGSPKRCAPLSIGRRVWTSPSPHEQTLITTKYAKKSKRGDDSRPLITRSEVDSEELPEALRLL